MAADVKMSRSREKEVDGCRECAAVGFRRTSSLRLRGERPLFPQQRAPFGHRSDFPIITEDPRAPRSSGVRPDARPLRQRSFSLNTTVTQKPHIQKSSSRTCPNSYMEDGDAAMTTPPGSPEDLPDDDSVQSCSSAATINSCDANYAPFNGTTFSGRSMRYVLHCSTHAGLSGEEYLTPTQRAQKQIRRLKSLLALARKELEKKNNEIFELTREVVELRLTKTNICSPDDKSNSSEAITIRENPEDNVDAATTHDYDETDAEYKQTPTRSHNSDLHSSFTDSGHFEECIQTKEHQTPRESTHGESDRRKVVEFYEKKIEELIRSHDNQTSDLKKSHNEKVESLLQKLSDVNTRYGSLLPDYETAREKIHELEKQLEDLRKQLGDEDAKHREAYLAMYNKGLEAAKLDSDKEVSAGQVSRLSVSQLLEQLQVTQTELNNVRDTEYSPRHGPRTTLALLSAKEAVSLWVLGARKAMYRRIMEAQGSSKSSVDPEVTLQFLKSAVYYFLTDPDNHQGHLNAIENILGFTEAEKDNIRKARYAYS